MKIEDYNEYYIQGSDHFLIPKYEFKEIFRKIEKLKDENIVYVKTKNGIFKCYKSEQMHKPIYYPIESKTNGYIDYNDVIRILNIDDLYEQVKKQKEVIDKAIEYIRIYRSYQKIDNKDYLKGRDEIGCLDIYQVDELLDLLNEVSE